MSTSQIGNGVDFRTVGHIMQTMDIYARAIEQNDCDAADTIGGILVD